MNQIKNQITTAPGQFVYRRRIGSTTYRVGVRFNPQAKETLDDKVLRLLKNDLKPMPSHVTMGLSQTGRLSERSSA